MCTNKYPLENQYCMRRFGEQAPPKKGSVSCVDPTGTQGLEFSRTTQSRGGGDAANLYFGTVAAYKKSVGFQPDATLKSSPVCREVFDYGWKSMEATKQKEYDLYNLRVFAEDFVGQVGGVGGAMAAARIDEPLVDIGGVQEINPVKQYGGNDGVFDRLALHLGIAGGSDADGLGYDAGPNGLKLGLACAVGDGRWADQHRRPNMTAWRCAAQRWEMVEAREIAVGSPAPYRICAHIDPLSKKDCSGLASCRKRCLGMGRNFDALLDLAADPQGGVWDVTTGVGGHYGIGSPWAARFAQNRLFVAYEFDVVSAALSNARDFRPAKGVSHMGTLLGQPNAPPEACNATDGRADTGFILPGPTTARHAVAELRAGEKPWALRLHVFDAESSPLTNLLPLTVSVFLNNGTGAPCGTRTWEDVAENRDLSVLHVSLVACRDALDQPSVNNPLYATNGGVIPQVPGDDAAGF